MDGADTIAAIATAAGRGAIGVVRVSGPGAETIARAILGGPLPARSARLADFLDASGAAMDRGIALYFPAPASYTGEDVLELQGHGGPVVLGLVLERCLELGARMADPGEFTRRAFLNDKVDLAQAEAVADLIDADTRQAARSAARSLAGEFSQHVAGLQRQLTDVRALFEASFDFAEEDIDVLSESHALQKLALLQAALEKTLTAARQGRLLRNGVTVALTGPTNVGKSSIINALSRNDVAIVTPLPGTTRDLVRSTISSRGIAVHLIDTAGLRATDDPVERIGIEKALEAARHADLVLKISDADSPHALEAGEAPTPASGKTIHVHNKIDLTNTLPSATRVEDEDHVWISAKCGTGLDLLLDAILRAVGGESLGEGVFTARQRHIEALSQAARQIDRATQCLRTPEFAAEELRLAQEALSKLTGEHAADDLLGEIFERFCIGK
jgi:tRNA modification GTPase